MIDTHCHIDMILAKSGDADLAAFKERAGWWPEFTVQVGCDGTRIDAAIALAEGNPEIRFTAGQHPHEAEHYTDALHARLIDTMVHPLCVGWGECGLDYHYDHSPREKQREVCIRQFEAAAELGKTLVVHSREADGDMLPLLGDLPRGHKVHLHCFTSSPRFAEEVLALPLDLSIGFTGIVTFPNASEVREAVRLTPVERMLTETDAPFLAPVPFRGKVCHPGMVREVGEALALLKELPIGEFDRITTANGRRLYSF